MNLGRKWFFFVHMRIRTIGEGGGCGGRSILALMTIVLLVEMFGFGTASFVLRIIDDLLLPIIFGC